MGGRQIPVEAVIDLERRLSSLPARSAQRRVLIQQTAMLYNVSRDTLYRALRQRVRPHPAQRADQGQPRVLPQAEMETYCEVIAALKVRTSNQKGRHLSTVQSIRLLEEFGVETPVGHLQAQPGVLCRSTVNRYLKQWGYDRVTLGQPRPCTRFQAEFSNECWQFDLSHSDLKQMTAPPWAEGGPGRLVLMLYSVVDDRSGVAYQEYHCVYGEDVEAALRFLFNAMAPKPDTDFPFQGIPRMIYTDNGPIAKSAVFQRVMQYLGIEIRTHVPAGQDSRRTSARAKGKVERPFRTVKEMHETLYHFHQPKDEAEANAWLLQFLRRYNAMDHREGEHSRMEDWVARLPATGLREMCAWERFCTFAREPERRTVGADARVVVAGVGYEVAPDLAGEEVVLWWGVFDHQLFVEWRDQRFGPYTPAGGPIPLHRYRQFKKTGRERRAERIETLAAKLSIPRAAVAGRPQVTGLLPLPEPPVELFSDPDPFQELRFPNPIAAKRAISDVLGCPLAKLSGPQMEAIERILATTLNQAEVLAQVRDLFTPKEVRHAQ